MEKKKSNFKARILKLNPERKADKAESASEVARSLFSETWRNYLDDVKIVAVTLNKKSVRKIKEKRKTSGQKKSRGKIKLVLKNDLSSNQ